MRLTAYIQRRHLFLLFLLPALMMFFFMLPSIASAIGEVTVKSNVLNVRSGPGLDHHILGKVAKGDKYAVIKEENNWLQIRYEQDKTGWVAKWLVDFTPSQINRTAVIQATTLNVRSGPDTSHSVVGKLNKGDSITVLEAKNGWYKIEFNGADAWIAGDFVADKAVSSSPSQEPDKTLVQVNTNVLNVRSSASLDADVVDRLSKGVVVEVVKAQDDWYEVQYDQKTGWIASSLTIEVSGQVSNQPKVSILKDGTNIRSEPGTNHQILARANQGDQFAVLATEGEWFQILLPDGRKGYVAGWIVSAEGTQNVERQGIEKHLKNKKIVIDPGHGGKDVGATGSHFKTLEKVANLTVSELLKEKFKAAGANVVMTRSTDRFLTLQQRVDISINEKADVFLSIHHNTNNNARINGTITYFYSTEDRALANEVQQQLVKNNGLNDLKARKGDFFVLRENPKLSVLVEIGFLSNYNDELNIRQSRFQENSANGILYGVANYFKKKEE